MFECYKVSHVFCKPKVTFEGLRGCAIFVTMESFVVEV